MEREANEKYRAPALDKGLDILELLSEQSDGLTRTEIVKAMGRGPSEIYRMLERLVARGYAPRPQQRSIYLPLRHQRDQYVQVCAAIRRRLRPFFYHQGSGRARRATGSLRFTFGPGQNFGQH